MELVCRDWGIKKFQTENNSLLIKNPQFLSNLNETWSKLTAHEWVILINFQWDWAKIVDFVLKENYFRFGTFLCLSLYVNWKSNSSMTGQNVPQRFIIQIKKYIFGSGKRSGHSGNQATWYRKKWVEVYYGTVVYTTRLSKNA